MEALIALAGVFVGGLVGFGGKLIVEEARSQRLSKQMAQALAGEIRSLIHVAEVRGYSAWLRKAAEEVRSGETGISIAIALSPDHYFKVFEANADKLGLLPDDLPEKVANFYGSSVAIHAGLTAMPSVTSADTDPDEQARIYEEEAELIDKRTELGNEIVPRLQSLPGVSMRRVLKGLL